MAQAKIRPVILSGGIGSRLWPLSRRERPKQFIPLAGGQSPFAQTLTRLDDQAVFSEPLIICAQIHRFLVRDILEQSGKAAHRILMEPCTRNTAPAIVAAALETQKDDPDGMILVLPSDHYIPDQAAFTKAVQQAAAKVQGGGYVLFGIKPTKPHTGYGYIECGSDDEGIQPIKSFKEKPNEQTAQSYLDQGGFVWNSGMFLLNVADFLDDVHALQPEMLDVVKKALENACDDLEDTLLDEEYFSKAPSISVDYAVMEHTSKGSVLPVSFAWSDLGAWDSLWEIAEKDAQGNAVLGDVTIHDVQNSYLRSEGDTLLCASGVEDITAVVTDDVVVITKRGFAEQVSNLVSLMQEKKREEASHARIVYRPWGSYETTSEGAGYKTKRIIVKPGKRLSLQKHKHRSEHWVVVQGQARVTLDKEVFDLQENQSTYIPAGAVHRLENEQDTPLILIEVQTGSYLEEDDIIRLDDDYGRKKAS